MGGIITGYVMGGSYKNGIINGGLSAGIVGFIYTLIVIVYTTGSTIVTAVNKAVATTALSGEFGIVIVSIIIFASIVAFGIYFILGLIGGIIGASINERGTGKPMPE
jgi:hypothetical protein